MVGPTSLFRWLRVWLPLSILYGLVLFLFSGSGDWQRILLLMGRLLIALLGMQILTWSVPPSDVVRAFDWVIRRPGRGAPL